MPPPRKPRSATPNLPPAGTRCSGRLRCGWPPRPRWTTPSGIRWPGCARPRPHSCPACWPGSPAPAAPCSPGPGAGHPAARPRRRRARPGPAPPRRHRPGGRGPRAGRRALAEQGHRGPAVPVAADGGKAIVREPAAQDRRRRPGGARPAGPAALTAGIRMGHSTHAAPAEPTPWQGQTPRPGEGS